MARARGDPLRCKREEARELQVRHQDHHADQQHDGVEIDGAVGVLQAQDAETDHEARADERGARPVDAQPRQPAEGNHRIGAEKDDERGDHQAFRADDYGIYEARRAIIGEPLPLPQGAQLC